MKRNNNDTIVDFVIDPKYKIYRHLLLQFFMIVFFFDDFLTDDDQWVFSTERFFSAVIGFFTTNMCIYGIACFLAPRFLIKKKFAQFTCYSLFLFFLFIFLSSLFDHNMGDIFGTDWLGNMVSLFLFGTPIILILAFGISSIYLLQHLLIERRHFEELQSSTLQSELMMLKQQINPHFLFNILNNSNVLIRKDPNEASRILYKVEDLLRYQFNDSLQESVALKDDIRFLNDYLNLEKIRRDRFSFNINIESDINDIMLPPLLFIPFVENAVKHSSDNEQMQYICITFKIDNGQLSFQCENTKPSLTEEQQHKGLGLSNIRSRLELLYSGRYTLNITDDKEIYIVFLQINLS